MEHQDDNEKKWEGADIVYHPIGVIHSDHTEHEHTPIQGIFNPALGCVEIFDEYADGLKDIESFSHLYLLYHFHRATGASLLQRPFLDGEKERGVFAIRHFNRPNPIGLSIVELKRVKGTILEVSGIDVLDGTPLIDIKPYVKQFDHRDDSRSGWVEDQYLEDIGEWNSTPKGLQNRGRTNV